MRPRVFLYREAVSHHSPAGLSSRLDQIAEATKAVPSPVANRGLEMPVEPAPSPASDAPVFRFQTFSWKEGDPPTRLIPVKNGLCFLSMVTGNLLGRGEAVEVTAGVDGWWYLNGKSQQVFSAQAIAVESDRIKLSPTVTSYTWRRGDAPVKMIPKSEGFCLLTGIGGGFHARRRASGTCDRRE